jgi:hypothetical protein
VLVQYVNNWREVMPLQNYITAVLALGMIEMATWYFDYVNFNNTVRVDSLTRGSIHSHAGRSTHTRADPHCRGSARTT